MQLLVRCYDKMLLWSGHEKAARYLAFISFVEASFFPIPPYFMLVPMALAKPNKAINYAFVATIASVLGGIVGYFLGYAVFKPIVQPLIEYLGYSQQYQQILDSFAHYGVWAILAIGFTPLPFKLVAISSGFMHVPFLAFLFAALVARSTKFMALAYLIKLGGLDMEQRLRKSLEKTSYLVGGLVVAATVGLIMCVVK